MRLSHGIATTALVALALLTPATSVAQIDPGLSVAAGNSWETRPTSPSTVFDPMTPLAFGPLAAATTPSQTAALSGR